MRKYLAKNQLKIVDEDMVEEDGKFYPMMKVVHGEPEKYEEYEYIYGKKLLEKKHIVLEKYLLREQCSKQSILEQLRVRLENSESARQRAVEMIDELELINQAVKRFE